MEKSKEAATSIGRRQFLQSAARLAAGAMSMVYAPYKKEEIKKQLTSTQIEQFEIVHQGFSEDERLALQSYLTRVVDILKQNYSTDFSQQKIIIKKVSLEDKKGHGHFSHYRVLDAQRQISELQIVGIKDYMKDEINHQIGHLSFTTHITSGADRTVETEEWITRVGEGIAQAITYELADPDISLEYSGIHSLISGEQGRRNSDLAQKRFDHSTAMYNAAAASMIVLKQKFPGLFDTFIDVYRQRYLQKNWQAPYEVFVSEIESRHPGFKQELAKEPALYFSRG